MSLSEIKLPEVMYSESYGADAFIFLSCTYVILVILDYLHIPISATFVEGKSLDKVQEYVAITFEHTKGLSLLFHCIAIFLFCFNSKERSFFVFIVSKNKSLFSS